MSKRLLLIVLSASFAALAQADDGWIGYTGAPKLMGSHPSVRMVSEVVKVTVHRNKADIVCDFVFKNEGVATSVRMGFPDYDEHTRSVDDLKSSYDFFHSYVDGKPVRVRLVPIKGPQPEEGTGIGYQEAYQVKTIRFKAHQTRRVREIYRESLGTIALSGFKEGVGTAAYNVFSYIFATGATWKGTIGRAELDITFAADASVGKGKIVLEEPPDYDNTTQEGAQLGWNWWAKHPNAVANAGGFKLSGRTIKLVKTNWKPTEADDISMPFGYYFRK